ncbi:unnamed protein product [Macrosiphum euphorbiae]|uniref:Uncharacterized protein n=1 Tax=Macrosiphum euphorbiae TaxID=13131 RepID=A0AAV0WW12_9HEMI|nr:unnamed protein product [Macrosiphum euphorbiae]
MDRQPTVPSAFMPMRVQLATHHQNTVYGRVHQRFLRRRFWQPDSVVNDSPPLDLHLDFGMASCTWFLETLGPEASIIDTV